jgi:GTPase SAR1 family protein
MARLHPANLDGLTPTRGEEQVFAHLKRMLAPDAEHWVWYEPLVAGKRGRRTPDFVILGPAHGVVVLEVKDWSEPSVVRGDAADVWVRDGEGERRETHPEKQAREASYAVRDALSRVPQLKHEAGEHEGQLVLPVNYGVAFPHMTRRDVARLAKRGVPIHPDKCLTREDLERQDDEGARRLLAGLKRLCDVCFPFELDDALRNRVRTTIEPQTHFFDLREETVGDAAHAEVSVASTPVTRVPLPEFAGFFLDDKQERMARLLASPRTLVYGPAGSGKTIFLVARAHYWLDQKPDARVLFTCYNSSLASHLRSVFAVKGIAPDGERLTVRHYHELCGAILGMADIHERSPEFYATLEPKVLQEMARREDTPVFDCILVDEGQDFTRRMMEVLVRLSAEGGEITVVCDPAQDIYGRWSVDNLAPMRDHATEHLVDCYRNTAPIFALALAVLSETTREAMGLNRLGLTRPEDMKRFGPPPELLPLEGLDDLITLIHGITQEFDARGTSLGDLAILYPDRKAIPNFAGRLKHSRWQSAADPRFVRATEDVVEDPADAAFGTLMPDTERDLGVEPEPAHFADALERELRGRGIPVEWVTRDFASKAAYDISRARLTLSTVHSAKGMDFHTVILLGAESLAVKAGRDRDRAAALLFTGATRARERLVIPYFVDRGWVPELRERLREIAEDPHLRGERG